MEVGKLTVQLRRDIGKGQTRKYRSQGLVPGVCYGASLEAPLSIVIDPKALKGSLDPARGRNTVIELTVQDGEKSAAKLTALLWEYQIDAVRRNVTHVDLISIDPEKSIEVEVPLNWVGKAVGTVDGGQIHVERHTLPVKCRPADIPVKFDIDISPLGIGDALHVSDVKMPSGVTAAIPEGFTLVTCVAPKAEKEAETAAVEGAVPAEGAEGAAAAGAEGAPAAAAGAAPAAGGKAPAAGAKAADDKKGGGKDKK
ncbi:MAG TPA: 50S ribosomal protein L25 [Kofleriaceae bacterium]|nr:50S ribosomal protein L25 [Kofleriaceae bacterium]